MIPAKSGSNINSRRKIIMKTKMTMVARILVSVLCLALLLTGCGKTVTPSASDSATPKASDSATPQESSENKPLENVKITFYCVGDSQDMTHIEEAVNEYLKDTLNITLEYECFGWGDTYTPKINPMLAAGEPIDIVFTSNWAANYRVNAVNGYFRELNDFLAKYPAIESVTGKDFLNATQINGKNYALPCNKEQAHNWGFLLKKDLVQEFGIDLKSIKSLEDLEPYFDKVLAEKPGITPLLAVQMDSPWHLLDWNTFSDDDVPGALYNDNRDTKVINQFLAPESIAQYKQMRDYFKKKYIHPDAATQDNFSAEMSTGKYFAFVAPMKPGKAVEMSAQTGIEWEEVFITPIVMSNREADGAMLAIPIGSKNPERAFQFIELLYTDAKLKNLMNYGVENRDYKFIGENRIEIIPNSGYASSGGWRFGDNFKDYLMAGEAENKAELWREYNKAGLPLINLGFVFDATNVANEVAACKDVVQTYYKQLFTGSVDPDPVVKEMEAAFKTAGADLVIAEMQKQFDEWLITNKK
jgi:putative aldouronate transport system substrate-binding protein